MVMNRGRSNPPPFLVKTYMLVDDAATDAVISWNEGGTAFVVWKPEDFSRDLLPTLFKHSNFSSFVRQLNTYGFKKVATNRWEFCNDLFQKGKRELLSQIQRRKSWNHRQQAPSTMGVPKGSKDFQNEDEDQRSSSTSSSFELNTLADENKRLREENGVLSSELTTMKKKCKELLHLVAIYTNQPEKNENRNNEDDKKRPPKLFGVRLDVHGGDQERTNKKRKMSTEIYDNNARLLLSQSCK